jgi:tetratricopeptide (TPR) repeat protein
MREVIFPGEELDCGPSRCDAFVYMVKEIQTKQEIGMRRSVLLTLWVLYLASPVLGAGGDEVPTPGGTPQVTGEAKYNEGLAYTRAQDWQRAEAAYRDAIRLKPALPEAWNELGHALKNQDRFDESIRAYEEALRLRPHYPQALEYLGEAYVRTGHIDKARALLARLQPLDARLAERLEGAIDSRSAKW